MVTRHTSQTQISNHQLDWAQDSSPTGLATVLLQTSQTLISSPINFTNF